MRRFPRALIAILTALLFQNAAAQYPSRPIRLLVPIPPGGGPDIVARLIAPKVGDALGQPVVVENRVGGNGNLAGELVAKSAADGYTLLLGMDSLMVINPHLYAKMPFDPQTDLAPVASLVSNGFFMAVNPSVPARTFPEFIEYARRANPPPATTATVAGEVAVMMSGTSTAPQIKAGRLRALAFTGPQRSRVLPEVPAIAEFYPDFVMIQWYGLFAPAGTPEPALARLRAEVNKALLAPDIRERLTNAGGVEPWITTPDEFAAEIRSEYAKYAKLVKDVGAKVD
jgi:tripartite-type tricarboxylate transporter receptor subunit TctC